MQIISDPAGSRSTTLLLLPRAFETACVCGPSLGPEDEPWWKIHLSADSVLAHTARTTQHLLSELWTPADWSPHSGAFCRQQSRQRLITIWLLYVCPLPGDRTGQQPNSSTKPASHSAAAWRSLWPQKKLRLHCKEGLPTVFHAPISPSRATKSFKKRWVLVLKDWGKNRLVHE